MEPLRLTDPMERNSALLYYGQDVRETLRQLPDASVHMACCSPPYFNLRDYKVDGQIGLEDSPEEYVKAIVEVMQAVRRVLRDDGTLWVNLGDSVGNESPLLYRHQGCIYSSTMGILCDTWIANNPDRVRIQPDGTEILYLDDADQIQVLSASGLQYSEKVSPGGVAGCVSWHSVSSLIRKPARKPMVSSKIGNRRIVTTTDHAFITPSGKSAPPRVGLKGVLTTGVPTESPDTPYILLSAKDIPGAFLSSPAIRECLSNDFSRCLNAARQLHMHPTSAYTWRKRNRVPLAIAQCLGLHNSPEVYLSAKTHPKTQIPVKFPLTDEVLTLLGLWVGDGSYDSSGLGISAGFQGPPRLVADFFRDSFGCSVSEASDGVTLRLTSITLKHCLRSLGFIGQSHTKSIPNWVFNLSRRQIGVFLSGYLYADGHFHHEDGHCQISFCTVSADLIRHLKDLFLLCGYEVRHQDPKSMGGYKGRRQHHVGYMRVAQIPRWMADFGFGGVKNSNIHAPRRGLGNISIVGITEVIPVEYKHPWVYDISVPDTENFVCDGVVLHNSYAVNGVYINAWAQKEENKDKDNLHSNDPGRYKDCKAVRGGEWNIKAKDLMGIPWRVAFALQADGWYLRSDIIWAKRNPLPESITDRPTKSHEYVFLFAKQPRYFYDYEGVKEPSGSASSGNIKRKEATERGCPHAGTDGNIPWEGSTRNRRSVWPISLQPYKEAHFATWPEELVNIMIRAGSSEKGCCPHCGAPWERVTEESGVKWAPTCDCPEHMPVPCTVLDPFSGSATTGKVAWQLGRNYIGIDINSEYLSLAQGRLLEAPAKSFEEPGEAPFDDLW